MSGDGVASGGTLAALAPAAAESTGVAKLLRRLDTLREWIEEGRSNYELARSFHVPIADVRLVIARLGLERPEEYEPAAVSEPLINRRCSACRSAFLASRFRFRCDECLEIHASWYDEEFAVAAVWQHSI